LIYRDQGKAGFLGSEHVRMGSAWRMSELHAATGLVHLDRLDEFIAIRRRVAAFYDQALRGVTGLTLLPEPVGSVGNYYKYPILLDARLDRTKIRHELRERHRVSLAGEVYARPLHCQPVFESSAHRPLPIAEDVCARQICLPVHSDMLEDEAEYVVESLIDVLGANGTGGRH
jgi:perosamine synthetase